MSDLLLPSSTVSLLSSYHFISSRKFLSPSHIDSIKLRLRHSPKFCLSSRFAKYNSKCFLQGTKSLNLGTAECNVTKDGSTYASTPVIVAPSVTNWVETEAAIQISPEENSLGDLTLKELAVQSEQEQDAKAATPAHPAGLYALYASFLAGNLVEQIWIFAWPAALAVLHPTLLPVAVVGFAAKLGIFVGGPLVGQLMDSFPRIFAFNLLSTVQTAAQLLSAGMIIYALKKQPHSASSSTSALFAQPWFIVLVVSGAIERLTGLASGVAFERDWVVLLAGANRPIALARANAMLSRIDLLCEVAGASIFGLLLSKFGPVSCLKLAGAMMIFTLPVLIFLVCLTDRLSKGVLERSKHRGLDNESCSTLEGSPKSLVKRGLDAIWCGWIQYTTQPVLPASLACVLLYFNAVLAPGGLMTTYLTYRGLNPSIIGAFSGLCSFTGVAATFISAPLVRKFGLLNAGAVGLLFQALALALAASVYWCGLLTQRKSLIFFLFLIVLSRLGHMSYDIVGGQILQTAVPSSQANLIGTIEVSMAGLAELIMLGIAIIANDVSHFGFLASLSVASVGSAAILYCKWLSIRQRDKHLKQTDSNIHGRVLVRK